MKTLATTTWYLCASLTLATAGTAAAQTEDAGGQDPPGCTMEDRCHLEIEQLHQFFQDWSTGSIENTDDGFERFAAATAESYVIISPSGRATDRQTLLDRMRGAHGMSPPSARIWIENFEMRHLSGDVAVVTYEQWQEVGNQKRGRISTAVFRAREDTPNGVEWLHLHETSLPRQQD